MNYLIAFMFIWSLACAIRSISQNDTDAMTAAGLFALAGCVLLK